MRIALTWACEGAILIGGGVAFMLASIFGLPPLWFSLPIAIAGVIVFEIGVRKFNRAANARLIAAAPDLLEALLNVRQIIVDGAMTGFNFKDGDWAERLYASQSITSAAIAKAEGKPE